jgi:hypothetical protein
VGAATTITWTSSGVSQPVTIALRITGSATDAAPALVIATSSPNDGSEPWTIPATLAPGDYFIRVRSDDATVIGNGASFHVYNAPTIVVTNPISGTLALGSSTTIRWTPVCSMMATVTIALRAVGSATDAAPTLVIATSTANDGTHPWTVPNDGSITAGNYFIRVRTDDATVRGDGAPFHIGEGIRIDPRWWLKKYIEVRWPPDPDPCMCPEWNIKELLERIRGIDPKFAGSFGLLKNGVKIQDLLQLNGRKVPLESLTPSLKPSLSRKNFDAFKNGAAKFSMGIFDAKGNLLQEIPLQGEQGQQLR